jgi:hypothetical protein
MLWTLCAILLLLWVAGLTTGHTASGLIHVLLVLGLAALVVRLILGHRIRIVS